MDYKYKNKSGVKHMVSIRHSANDKHKIKHRKLGCSDAGGEHHPGCGAVCVDVLPTHHVHDAK